MLDNNPAFFVLCDSLKSSRVYISLQLTNMNRTGRCWHPIINILDVFFTLTTPPLPHKGKIEEKNAIDKLITVSFDYLPVPIKAT